MRYAAAFFCFSACLQSPPPKTLRFEPDAVSRSGLIALISPSLIEWAFANCQLEQANDLLPRAPRHDDFATGDDLFLHPKQEKPSGPRRARFSNLMLVSELSQSADRWLFACPTLPPRTDEDRALQAEYAQRGPRQNDGTPLCAADAQAPEHGVFIVFRLRPASDWLPPIPPRMKAHHFRMVWPGIEDQLAMAADPSARIHPGSVFVAPVECLEKCEREALRIDAHGKPAVPAQSWLTAHCQVDEMRFNPAMHQNEKKAVDDLREISWSTTGDATLYWNALGVAPVPTAR